MIAATIFSASNYPKGAGEPSGNKAAVVVLEPREPGNLANSLVSWPAWRVGFQEGLMPANNLSDVPLFERDSGLETPSGSSFGSPLGDMFMLKEGLLMLPCPAI